MSFSNKVVLVTGASSGIGAAIAIKFSEDGASVAIVGRNENKLKNVSEICKKRGKEPLVIIADVSKDSDVKKIINETLNYFGKLDVLINNAGIAGSVSILSEHAIQIYDQVMATNLRSVVYLTNLAAKHIIETKGNIINISSVASLSVITRESFSYCVSKASLDHFTRCIALELATKGVRVNTINPGPVKTDIVKNLGTGSETFENHMWDMMKRATVLDRIADPEEIADLALFLASDKAKSITGATIVSDNGAVMTGPFDKERINN